MYFNLIALLCAVWSTIARAYPEIARFGNASSALQRETMVYIGKFGNITWPDRTLTSKVNGNIVLGGLMMVHERSEKLICGPIMAQGGIQALEMMLYTIDAVNNDSTLLPGIKLGAHIKDDCDRDTYGLEQSVDFIKGRKMFF